MKVFLTGASGFIGSRLAQQLHALTAYELASVVRNENSRTFGSSIVVEKIHEDTNWNKHLREIDCVIHAAAQTHVIKNPVAETLSKYKEVNIDGTLNLARQASSSGVKRFIFISSIKVNGEHTQSEKFFSSDDIPNPEGPYGISKYEAELGLLEIANKTSMEVVIIRPPLVYGPGVKGNFARLIKLIEKGLPLPLGAINNKRSI